MLQTATVKAFSNAAFLRRSSSAYNIRTFSVISSKPANTVSRSSSKLHLALRRPLAVLSRQQVWNQKRYYAVAAEESSKGVVCLLHFLPFFFLSSQLFSLVIDRISSLLSHVIFVAFGWGTDVFGFEGS